MRSPTISRRLRRYPLAWWIAVLLLATTIGLVVSQSVGKAQAAAARYDGLTNVYVVTHDIDAGALLSRSDVKQESRPRAFVPKTPVTDDPVGQIATLPLTSGEVLVHANLGDGHLSPSAALLRTGERAIAIDTNNGSFGVSQGDWVDVFATLDAIDITDEPSTVVANNARVVEVTDDHVTIAVRAEEAPHVAYSAVKGAVTLAITRPQPE